MVSIEKNQFIYTRRPIDPAMDVNVFYTFSVISQIENQLNLLPLYSDFHTFVVTFRSEVSVKDKIVKFTTCFYQCKNIDL